MPSTQVLKRLQEITAKLLFPLNTHQMYRRIVLEASELVGASYGSLFFYQKRTFVRVFSNSPMKLRTDPRPNGRVYEAYMHGQSFFDTWKKRRKLHPESKTNFLYECLVPLQNRGRTIGVLTLLFTKKPLYSPRQVIEILEFFGTSANIAIRKSQLYDDLRTAIRSRDLFISIAAHELRTPLTTIMGGTDLIYKRIQEKRLPEERWVELIKEEARRMKRLVNELLTIQQIESRKFHYTWEVYNIKDLLRKTIDEVHLAFRSRNIIFTELPSSDQCVCLADADKLSEVFSNVLHNAHKFSPADIPIHVKIFGEKSTVNILIEDQGSGIPRKSLHRIFEGFYKSEEHMKEGLGLGLYVSKRIITQHKGTISIDSKIKKGTRVTITLPKHHAETTRE